MIQTYVEFVYPGIVVPETSTEKTNHRDPNKIKIPKNSYGFRFYDREILEGTTGKLYGKQLNESNWFYKGRVKTLNDVEREEPNTVLHRNMKYNKINRVVVTEFGQAIPMEDEDIMVCGGKSE